METEELTETGAPEGQVDSYDSRCVKGWVWYPARPALAVTVEIVIDGETVAEAIAHAPRGDLAAAGKRGGECGFSIPLKFEPASVDRVVQVTLRAKNGPVLTGGAFNLELPAQLSALPVGFAGKAGFTGCLDQFGPDMITGWVRRAQGSSPPIEIEFWQAGSRIFSLVADIWRTDLEDRHQGDGRWGFAAPVPAVLRDGKAHVVEICLAGDRSPMTEKPLRLSFPAQPPVGSPPRADATADDSYSMRTRPPRADAPDGVYFSFILNFYNMRREAERTLTSLTRRYQQGIGNLSYEVLCIDNGSSPPMDPEWVASFGPEFRLIRPSRRLPSPCAAINEAARMAKGRYLAIMIDGAHILTPGVLREAWDSFAETPEAVVGLRPWFVGGDQRWLAVAGYTRDQEDLLFDKIGWPHHGYKLFKVGGPYWESPTPWLDGMIESNCLFVPSDVYARIGGIDEDFDEPGAGYANLDLFKRAVAAVPEPLIALLGEATFHQFHEGTTTNVSDEEKERRVRSYENKYIRLRGEPFTGIAGVDIRQRGQLRAQLALAGRQRFLSPARIGVTEQIRVGSLPMHFDHMSAANLQAVYVECGLHKLTKWLGHDVSLAPADIAEIQDVIFQLRPDRIVVVNAGAGVVAMLDSLLKITGLTDCRILLVGEPPSEAASPASVDWIEGEPDEAETLLNVERQLGAAADVLVLFSPLAHQHRPIDSLRAYGRFVSRRSYLIFLGTVFGQPWLGYSKNWYQSAIRSFVAEAPFVIDESRNRQLVTTCPDGFLQRLSEF